MAGRMAYEIPGSDADVRDVSVVICTLNRPILLRKAIASAARQSNRLGLDFEIVVVDNSVEKGSQGLVKAAQSEESVPIRYVWEPRSNISLARNRGIRETQSLLVAFLDDDEEADPDWLDELVGALRHHDADVVLGPVLPIFEGGRPPQWDPTGAHFACAFALTTGTRPPWGYSGNSLIRRATCLAREEPFDPIFGSTGGEDTDFFRRLEDERRRIIWSSSAIVRETQPIERQSISYRSYRKFCAGKNFVRVKAKNSGLPWAVKFFYVFYGFVQVSALSLPYFASLFVVTPLLANARLKFFSGLGKLLWMLPQQAYAKRQ